MTALVNSLQEATPTLLEAKDRASATWASAAFDLLDYDGQLLVYQACVAATGAQTLVGVVETSDASGFGSGVSTVATFPTFTQSDLKADESVVINKSACKRYLRINATIAGTTPAISSAHCIVGYKKIK